MSINEQLAQALRRLESAVDWHLGRSGFTQSTKLKGVEHSANVRRELFAAHDEARATLAALRAQPAPDEQAAGQWRMVPVEPTEAMLRAADALFAQERAHHSEAAERGDTFMGGPSSSSYYTSMLAAAPHPPAQRAHEWSDEAVLSVLHVEGDGSFGSDDIESMRRCLLRADEIRADAEPAQRAQAEAVRLQGGMDNEELREAWAKKVPGVEPTDEELRAFALGVEVGDVPSRTYFNERNSARDAWRRRVKRCEELEAEVARLSATPQQAAGQTALSNGQTLWLWKNGDHFLAFEHLYPCYSPGGDPMTLGEPFGRAEFRASFNRSDKG